MRNSYLKNIVWALEPEMLKTVDEVISARLMGEQRDLAGIEAAFGPLKNEKSRPYRVVDRVAVIGVNGIVGKRFNMMEQMSGGTSSQFIQSQLEDALTDPEIDAIVMSVDSPGGTVDGTVELGDFLLANRGIKPIYSYVDGKMASAAYWWGACTDHITAFRSSQVGNMGCRMVHYDRSGADKKAGIKRTFITSGEYKAIGNDAEPLSEKGEEYLQDTVDRYYGMFVEAVASGRGMDPGLVHEKFGDGRVYLAEAALEIGMIDAIGTLAETIEAARSAAMEEDMNKAQLKEKHPELYAELVAEGRAEAAAEFEGEVGAQGDRLVAAEQNRLFGLYGKLHGPEAGASFQKLSASGVDVAAIDALEGCGFGRGPEETAAARTDEEKARILAALERDGDDVNAGDGRGTDLDFMAQVDAMVAEKGIKKIDAIVAVAKANPDLHAAYLTGKQ